MGAALGVATDRALLRSLVCLAEAGLIFFVPDAATVREEDVARLHSQSHLTSGLEGLLRSVQMHVTRTLGLAPKLVIPVVDDRFHRTTSGKIQRGAFKKEFLDGGYAAAVRALTGEAEEASSTKAGDDEEATTVTAKDGIGSLHMHGFDEVNSNFHRMAEGTKLMPDSLRAWYIETIWGEFMQQHLIRQLFGDRSIFFMQVREPRQCRRSNRYSPPCNTPTCTCTCAGGCKYWSQPQRSHLSARCQEPVARCVGRACARHICPAGEELQGNGPPRDQL